jgi:tetratricopeptide (TPR) repeat protein
MCVVLIVVLAAMCAAPLHAERQQPETLSLLGEPLSAPKLPKAARSAADAELARAHAAYTAAPSGVPEILALARAHRALGRVGDALIILTNGLEANPDAPELLLERGGGYILIRKFDVAARDLTKAAAKLPAARCSLGFAQYLAADYDRARKSYADCAGAGVFGYLAERRAGGTPSTRPVPEGPAGSAPPPIRFPGAASGKAAPSAQSLAATYLDAIDVLLAGDEAGARDRLKKIVEKNRRDWMEPAYIAAEADYARLKGRR